MDPADSFHILSLVWNGIKPLLRGSPLVVEHYGIPKVASRKEA